MVCGRYPFPRFLNADFLAFCQGRCSVTYFQTVKGKLTCLQTTPTLQPSAPLVSNTRCSAILKTRSSSRLTVEAVVHSGDAVVVFAFGCSAPLVLRSTSIPSHYELGGQCFVDDLVCQTYKKMNRWRDGLLQEKEIVLI